MAVRLRLMRMGKKKQPTYRVVAADARSPRDGRFIEIVGTYDPRNDPAAIKIDNDRAVHWLRHGAQPTERVEKLLKISGAWDDFSGTTGHMTQPPPPKKAPAPAAASESPVTEAPAAAEPVEAPEGPAEAEPVEVAAAPVEDTPDAAGSGEGS